MQRLSNIDLNKEELDILLKENTFDFGGEGIILNPGDNKLYKIFNDCLGENEINEMSQNKFNKLKLLYKLDLDYMVKILSTITLNGILIGYALSYDLDDMPLCSSELSSKEIISVLKKAKSILTYFHGNSIVYGDIHSANILVNKKTGLVKFCDIDNIMIEDYFFDLLGDSLKKYINKRRIIDSTVDAYTHNITTIKTLLFTNKKRINRNTIISMLYDECEADCIAYLLNQKSRDHYRYGPIRKITKDMLKPAKYDGKYIINEL